MIQFQNDIDWIVGLMCLIWLIGLVLDIQFRIKRFRLARLVVWSLAIGSIVLIYLKPFRFEESRELKLAIIGDGSKSRVDSLKNMSFVIKSPSSYQQLLLSENVSELALINHTLAPWELEAANADAITIKGSTPKGILDFSLPSNTLKGEEAQIETLTNSPEQHTAILMLGDGVLDSAQLEAGLRSAALRFTPKASGNFVYQIVGVYQSDTIYSEPIAIKVGNPDIPSILMLNSNPSFEARFLKNHLGDFGYSVSSRTRISKDIFNEEFINIPHQNLSSLSASTLEQFQLLVCDATAFSQLSNSQKRRIKDLNKRGNLGVLVISSPPEEMENLWSVAPGSTPAKTSIHGNDLDAYQLSQSQLKHIETDGKSIGYYEVNGIGKIGLLAISKLYQLRLDGQNEAYEHILEKMIQPLLPYQRSDVFVKLPSVVKKDTKTDIQFASTSENPSVFINENPHPIRESAYRPNLYQTSFWPQKPGWNNLTISPDSVQVDYYVYSANDWVAKEENERLEYSRLFAATYQKRDTAQPYRNKRFIPEWYFLVVFVMCMGALWAEQRFMNR